MSPSHLHLCISTEPFGTNGRITPKHLLRPHRGERRRIARLRLPALRRRFAT